MKEKRFKLHWRYGKPEIVEGITIQDAMTGAGIGQGALPALDYWEELTDEDPEARSQTGGA